MHGNHVLVLSWPDRWLISRPLMTDGHSYLEYEF